MKDEPEADRHVIPRRVVSMPDDLWDELGLQVGDGRRSETIRDLVKWWLRRPGVKMPKRPPAAD